MALYIREGTGSLLQVKDVTPGPDLYEQEIEELIWDNLEVFAGEALFPLRRQAPLPGGALPDILALDSVGRVVVIEVKRDIDRRQLAQTLEYAGWARSTNLDELAAFYFKGADGFFSDWTDFTESSVPVLVNHAPRLVLVARDIHPRTKDALRFLADNSVPIDVVSVYVYEDDAGRRFFDIRRESEAEGAPSVERAGGGGTASQRSYMIDGHAIRVSDLVDARLLPPGTEIVLPTGGKTTHAVITEDGNIQVGEQRFSFPSAAGVVAVGHSVDGWVRWKVPSQNSKSLADLRNTLLERVAAEDRTDGGTS